MTDYEAQIYLALIKSGQISAYELAEKTGLYRQATYDALNRLIEKGYVSSVKEGKSRKYKAIDPKLILEHLKERTSNYEQILPELESFDKASKQKMVVETYKGKAVILNVMFRDIINTLKKTGGENWCTAVDESVGIKDNPAAMAQYERDMVHYGFKEKVLIKAKTEGVFRKGASIYRKIPEEYFNPNPTQVYGDNVSILVWGNPAYLIIIRNKDIADAYRKQFSLLWKIAKP